MSQVTVFQPNDPVVGEPTSDLGTIKWLLVAWTLSLGLAFLGGMVFWQQCSSRLRQMSLKLGEQTRGTWTHLQHSPTQTRGPSQTESSPETLTPAMNSPDSSGDTVPPLPERPSLRERRRGLEGYEAWEFPSPAGRRSREVVQRLSSPNSVMQRMVERASTNWRTPEVSFHEYHKQSDLSWRKTGFRKQGKDWSPKCSRSQLSLQEMQNARSC